MALYIVATPIGNLKDITLRAIETLKNVDLIACEDTRITKKLLFHYQIEKPLISFHDRSKLTKFDKIIEEVKNGKEVAVVTDAGTPGISDPGNKLVERALIENIAVIPIPGPSALTALASVSGIDMNRFVFLGFPPHKKGRQTFLKEVAAFKLPVAYYDSVHRFMKNLEFLKDLELDKNLIVGREITKMFEETVRGSISEVLEYFRENPDKQKGEFVIIVY